MDFDLIVVGTGPGGEGAAMKAAKEGLSVAVVESYFEVGGGCTHWATIPSKALRQVVQQLRDFRGHPLFHRAAHAVELDYPALLKTAAAVIDKQVEMRRSFYERNGVRVLGGRAAFVAPGEIEIRTAASVERRKAKSFVLAVGSRPYRPPDIDFSHPRVLDSDKVLSLERSPRSITIYGAGVIGCEYASIFRGLEVKVNLVNTRDRLLSFLDDEIINALSYHLADQGVVISHDNEYAKVLPSDDGVVLELRSGRKLRSDYLLWANGRTGNTAGLGLEVLGIKPDGRGNLPVDEFYRAGAPGVYAVGDVIGPPSLASAAYDQGRLAAEHIVFGKTSHKLEHVPAGIYTSPEISSVGLTERELTAKGVPYEVGHAQFRSLARAQIIGWPIGMLKLIFHRETLELLGVHCFGPQASEIIHIGQAILSQKAPANSLLYFINTTFNYPTMAEAYRVAALNGYNRLYGIMPRM